MFLFCCLCFDRYVVRLVDVCFFFQAEDGIRDLVRSRGLGDVYKRQYAYQFALPDPFQAAAGTKYWLQIQAFQSGPPDWAVSYTHLTLPTIYSV